jgi:hypothetical protein
MGNSSDSDIGYGIKLCENFRFPWDDDSGKWVSEEGWWFFVNHNREYIQYDEVKGFLKIKPVPFEVIFNGGYDDQEPILCIASTVQSSDWNKIININPIEFFKLPSPDEIKAFWDIVNIFIKPLIASENYEDEEFDLTLKWYWVNSWG